MKVRDEGYSPSPDIEIDRDKGYSPPDLVIDRDKAYSPSPESISISYDQNTLFSQVFLYPTCHSFLSFLNNIACGVNSQFVVRYGSLTYGWSSPSPH
jgi:hypothetical protein